MSIWAVLLVGAAQADEILIPFGAEVAYTLPVNGDAGVPVDVVPKVIFSVNCGDDVFPQSIELRDGDATVAETTYEACSEPAVSWRQLVELRPASELTPNTAYQIVVAGTTEFTSEFRTGTGYAAAAQGEPSVVLTSAVVNRRTRWISLAGDLTRAPDPDELSVVEVRTAGGAFVADIDSFTAYVPLDGSPPSELCVTPVQIDGAGREVAGDEGCMAVQDAGGCSSIGTAGGSLATLAAGLIARRRARRR